MYVPEAGVDMGTSSFAKEDQSAKRKKPTL